MSDELNQFFNKMPEGYGLVPLQGPHTEAPEPEAPDYKTLAGGFPGTQTNARPSDKRGYARLHIDSQIEAKRRRHVNDPVQAGWDHETDAKYMMKCAGGEHGLAAVIPLARVMERMKIVLAGRCGGFDRVSSNMTDRALHTAARCFVKGDIEWTIKLMAPIHSLIVRRPGPEAMLEVLATFMRDLFPAAPQTYIPPKNRVGNQQAVVNRTPEMSYKQAQAARKVVVKHAPDLEKIKLMSPERARVMLPAMRSALADYRGEDREQFAQAIDLMRKIGEQK